MIAHFYDWWLTDDRLYESVYAEYAEFGEHVFALPNTHMLRLPQEPEFVAFLKKLNRKYGTCFKGAHAHWGETWDPNTTGEHREAMQKNLRNALAFTAEFESEVLVIHPGYSALESDPGHPVAAMRQRCIETLNELLPLAEKLGVAIALENNISPADTPEELLKIMEYFSSPYLGCCFDTGHAHMMAYTPEKKTCEMHDFALRLWSGDLELFHGDAMKMLAPYILICHLHDNNGLLDQHRLPGDGSVDWVHFADVLAESPRLICLQNEALPSASKASIAASCRCFQKFSFHNHKEVK